MYAFMRVPRSYAEARRDYRCEIPEHFNFGFDVIDRRAREADKTAVIAVAADGEVRARLSYGDLARRSSRVAAGLKALGVKRGDFACLVAGRIPEWYDVIFGCIKAGVVAMPGTTLLTAKDLAYRIQQSGASTVIVSPEHCAKVDQIRAECPSLKHCIVIGPPREGWTTLEALTADQPDEIPEAERVRTRADEMMLVYFTSGTTALPKMVPRNHGYGLAHASTGLFWMDLQPEDVHWTLTDTGWAKAAWGMLFPQFLLGVTVVLYDGSGFDADLHLRLIKELGVTTFCAPPTVYRLFAQHDLSAYDLSGLRRSLGAGEPLNPEVIRIWQKATGTTIADGYGQTETVNIVANFPDQPVKLGAMGRPVPGFEIEIIDDAGQVVSVGEIGHVGVKLTDPWPPGLFEGYYTGDGLDRASFRHGWYYTGDTARMDQEGYLWFVGRADDLISSAGYRISPFEVESALLEHPAVAESAVIGEPDPIRGQIVSAYIILAAGHQPGEALAAEIQEFCKAQTAPYKYPRKVTFVTELPKTISGKIRRVELRGEG